ncbi:MAG: hypothetical protein HZC55_21145 [Verrucomicrobia bacterium]|nr:hypothetical protein [Verrucomicrobiota bacterium]
MLALVTGAGLGAAVAPFRIQLVERGGGWPVPLVELRTTHQVRFVSDNAGVIAFDLPEGMGRELWFEVKGHGYEIPADGFGYRGVRLVPTPGGAATVELRRTAVARRLGRSTGAGLLGESLKLGSEAAAPESGVFGCDSVQAVVHRGRLYWFWGDTTLPHYPLGVFHMSGATTAVRPIEQFTPPLRLTYDYWRAENGRPRAVATMPGTGPSWISGCVVLPDNEGRSRLVGLYAKVKPPLDVYEYGLCVWNDETANFEPRRVIWKKSEAAPRPPVVPEAHAFTDGTGPQGWVYFGNPLPRLRCRATFEAWQEPAAWERLEAPEALVGADGTAVKLHSGAVGWHPWRKRWVTIFTQAWGKPSAFGEVWYAEAPTPTGPWGRAVKVLTHDNYTFYNPRWHAEWATEDSPALIFEGTFSREFAEHAPAVARHDYNQVLYRLDLDDAALAPARESRGR